MSLQLAWTRDEKAEVHIRLPQVTILVLRPWTSHEAWWGSWLILTGHEYTAPNMLSFPLRSLEAVSPHHWTTSGFPSQFTLVTDERWPCRLLVKSTRSLPAVLSPERWICPLVGLVFVWSFFLPSQNDSSFHLQFPSVHAIKVPLQYPVSKSSSEMCSTPSHLLKPRNTKFLAWDLSADSWISQRWILASSHCNPQQLDTPHTFTRKRPVIGFAGRTTSEINVLCIAIYLPWVCVCVSVPGAKPSHCSLPYTQSAILVTEGLSELSPNSFWKRCIIWRGGLLSWLRQAGTWLPNQFAPPSHKPLFSFHARKQALKRKAIWQYWIIHWSGFERGTSQVNSAPSFLIEGNQAVSHWI